ncbi:MAG TPA: hypothetical protein VFY48_11625 [Solirubrobacterales bacterium]|nr:hypothetical protein [Solirubrobacterales bacterium]
MNPTPEDEPRIAEEEAEAAREAARIGGTVPAQDPDPARRPLTEAGQGEAEGFELAEKELEESASHGDSRGFPAEDLPDPEEPTEVEYGEADESIPADGSQFHEKEG